MLCHVLHKALARHQKTAREVGVQHGLPALGADAGQGRDVLPARVVDQGVDAPVAGQHFGHQRFDGSLIPYIRSVPADPGLRYSGLLQLGLNCRQLVLIAPHQGHGSPRDASSCATQRPMPEPPPVTTTTCPANNAVRNTDWYINALQ